MTLCILFIHKFMYWYVLILLVHNFVKLYYLYGVLNTIRFENIFNPRTPMGSFWPYIFLKSNSFWIFLCPLLLNSWVLPLNHHVHFLCLQSHCFLSLGALSRDWLEIFGSKKLKKGQNWQIGFFWISFTWYVAKLPICVLSGFWDENSKTGKIFRWNPGVVWARGIWMPGGGAYTSKKIPADFLLY